MQQNRLEELRERFKQEKSFQLVDQERRWLCPFCANAQDITLPKGGRPGDAFFQRVEAHIAKCKAHRILSGRPRPVEELRAKVMAGARARQLGKIRNKIDRHSLWRVRDLDEAFGNAAREYGYRGRYRGAFPIKVNQQRHVVEELVGIGVETGMGLEVGSKPELLAATAVLGTENALLICNGYKDRSYIESALLAQQLGRNPIMVIERFEELPLALEIAGEGL